MFIFQIYLHVYISQDRLGYAAITTSLHVLNLNDLKPKVYAFLMQSPF